MRRKRVPEVMQAAAIDRFGGPDALKVRTMPVPKVGAQEVLIAIHTAGVGVWDLKAERRDSPLILGVDGSGTVEAVGSRVKRFSAGDRVYAYSYDNPKGGFYAEYVVVAAGNVAPVPDELDMRQAGAVAVIALTALQGVDDALRIKKGESVIIHGASGNVGMLAVQFAKWRGARVLATASGKDGVKFVTRLGADVAIDGKRADIVAAARDFAPDGADALLALVGGPELTRCLDGLRKGGRVAYPNGVEPEPRKRRGLSMKGYDGVPGVRQFERLRRAIHDSGLAIPIAADFGLEYAALAHRHLEKGHVLGKVILRVSR
jgi:NADPH2:quinone reductase